jgi:hypothetical protein
MIGCMDTEADAFGTARGSIDVAPRPPGFDGGADDRIDDDDVLLLERAVPLEGDDDGGEPPPPPPRPAPSWVRPTIDFVIVAAAVIFTLAQLHPNLLVANTTPAGGDMGAHVWGPAFLRDHLLPHGRLSGWTPDWYDGFPAYQFYMVLPSLLIVALDVVLPYGIAFKLVTVLGVLSLPLAAYAFGRLTRMRWPTPAVLAVATVPFLFNREPLINNTGNIIGGNVASTLAGEFAFSISLSLLVLYMGVMMRGLSNGKHRALAAVLFALVALCHLIPMYYAIGATAVAFLMRPSVARVKWLATVLPVGGLITAFWVLPFYARRAYVNDMGWNKVPDDGTHHIIDFLAPSAIRWAVALAVVGAVLSIVFALRAGILLTGCAALTAVAFAFMPEWRLWNARLIPFWLLCIFLLAGIAIGELGRAIASLVARDPRYPVFGVEVATPILALLVTIIVVGLPLNVLPLGHRAADGSYSWMGIRIAASDRNVVSDWARWNYTGYERKTYYPEYYGLMSTMADVGKNPNYGCGRAMWEYENDRLNNYGTPMAPMLLPFWTDGCIGSMEGLYFEASATTPYHFLNQSELSAKPSRAQRDLPYRSFDIKDGIAHLQLLGVRYYLAFSDEAVNAANASPELTPIATSGAWHVYEVANSDMVTGLDHEPAVLTGISDANSQWLGPSISWYQDSSRWPVMLASSGPASWTRVPVCEAKKSSSTEPEWQRLDVCANPSTPAVDRAKVSNIVSTDDRISFDVDHVGTPVLVKASYFPNWQVSGAEGPYRVAPNLMVVVPTSNHVSLHYGWTPVDDMAWLLTLAGIALAVVLWRRPPIAMPPEEEQPDFQVFWARWSRTEPDPGGPLESDAADAAEAADADEHPLLEPEPEPEPEAGPAPAMEPFEPRPDG